MRNKKKEESLFEVFEEIISNYNLQNLDKKDFILLENMLNSIPNFQYKYPLYHRPSDSDAYKAIIAIVSQNFIFLKYLLKIEEQNTKLTEQNQQVIGQNQQIIELLTEIKNK